MGRLSVGQVREWDPARMQDVATSLQHSRSALVSLGADLPAGAGPTVWQGPAASAAYLREESLAAAERAMVTAVAAVQRAVDEAAARVRAVQGALDQVQRLAAGHRLRVDDDGVVRDTGCLPTPADADRAAAMERDRERAREAARASVHEVLRAAVDIDDAPGVGAARGGPRRHRQPRHGHPRRGVARRHGAAGHRSPLATDRGAVRRRDLVACPCPGRAGGGRTDHAGGARPAGRAALRRARRGEPHRDGARAATPAAAPAGAAERRWTGRCPRSPGRGDAEVVAHVLRIRTAQDELAAATTALAAIAALVTMLAQDGPRRRLLVVRRRRPAGDRRGRGRRRRHRRARRRVRARPDQPGAGPGHVRRVRRPDGRARRHRRCDGGRARRRGRGGDLAGLRGAAVGRAVRAGPLRAAAAGRRAGGHRPWPRSSPGSTPRASGSPT